MSFGARPWCDVLPAASNFKPAPSGSCGAGASVLAVSGEETQHSSLLRVRVVLRWSWSVRILPKSAATARPPPFVTAVVRRTSCSLQLHASAAWLAQRWRVGPPYVRASPKVTIGGDVGSRGEKWRGASGLKIGAHLGGHRARRRRRRRTIAPSRGVYRRRFHGKAHPTHRPNAKDRSRISAHAIELYFARHGWTWVNPIVS